MRDAGRLIHGYSLHMTSVAHLPSPYKRRLESMSPYAGASAPGGHALTPEAGVLWAQTIPGAGPDGRMRSGRGPIPQLHVDYAHGTAHLRNFELNRGGRPPLAKRNLKFREGAAAAAEVPMRAQTAMMSRVLDTDVAPEPAQLATYFALRHRDSGRPQTASGLRYRDAPRTPTVMASGPRPPTSIGRAWELPRARAQNTTDYVALRQSMMTDGNLKRVATSTMGAA